MTEPRPCRNRMALFHGFAASHSLQTQQSILMCGNEDERPLTKGGGEAGNCKMIDHFFTLHNDVIPARC